MLKNKLPLTNELKNFIKSERTSRNLKLIDLESASSHSAAWFSQIEGERTKTIKREDLIDIFRIILKTENNLASKEEAENYIWNFIKNNSKSEIVNPNNSIRVFKIDEDNDNINLRLLEDSLDTLQKTAYQFYEAMSDKKEAIRMFQIFSNYILMDIGFMLSLNCLKWDRLSNSDDETKLKILNEINILIQKYGSLSPVDQALSQTLSNFNPDTDRPDFTHLL